MFFSHEFSLSEFLLVIAFLIALLTKIAISILVPIEHKEASEEYEGFLRRVYERLKREERGE